MTAAIIALSDCQHNVRAHVRHYGSSGGILMLMPPHFVQVDPDGTIDFEWCFGRGEANWSLSFSPNTVDDEGNGERRPWTVVTRDTQEEWWGGEALPNLVRLLAEGTAQECAR